MRRAAIVSPIRTAVGKYLGSLSDLTAGELGAVVLKALVERTKIDPQRIDDVIFAQGYASGEAPCIARYSALAAGLPIEIPGYQLDRRCGSGLQAVIDAAMMVQTGVADVVIAGGVESMSNAEYYTTDMRKGARAGSVTMNCQLLPAGLVRCRRGFGGYSSHQRRRKGGRKGDAAHLFASFFGRPLGRIVNSRPSSSAVSCSHSSSPYGRPRCMDRRNASTSASVCGLFTCAAQSRGILTGQSLSRARGSACVSR